MDRVCCTATVLYYATVQYCVVQGGGGQEGQGGLAGHQVGAGRQGHRRLKKDNNKYEYLVGVAELNLYFWDTQNRCHHTHIRRTWVMGVYS